MASQTTNIIIVITLFIADDNVLIRSDERRKPVSK